MAAIDKILKNLNPYYNLYNLIVQNTDNYTIPNKYILVNSNQSNNTENNQSNS